MNRHLKYGLVLLLGLMAQVAVFAENVGDIPYTVWHGRRGGENGQPIDLYQRIDPSYVQKDTFAMKYGCSPWFWRPDLTSYAVISGENGDATAVKFKYTPTEDNPLFYIYYASEIYVGIGQHAYPFQSIIVYDNGSPIGCSYYHLENENGMQPDFNLCYESTIFYAIYRPWDVLSYDFSNRIGHELTIEVISTCCSNYRCWTRMYVAFEKDKPKDLCPSCASTTLTAPTYSNPTWRRGSETGPIVGTGSILTVQREDIDDYYCIPGNSCPTPLLLGKALHVNGDFTYSTSCTAGGDTVYLQNKSYMYYKSEPGKHIPCDTVVWDFGDGRTSSDPNLSYIVYDTPGQYEISLHVGSKGFQCDTIVTQIVPFGRQNVTNVIDTTCQENLPYIWRGRPYTVSGDYTDTLVASTGCDSVLHLLLTVLDTTVSTTTYSICEGETIRWNGKSYSQAGTYRDTLVNVAGCDSLLTLHIQYKDCTDPKDTTDIPLNPMPYLTYRDTLDTILCVGDYIEWKGKTYTEEGTYAYDTGYYWFGWDSVYYVIHIQTYEARDSIEYDTVCVGEPAPLWHGQLMTESRAYYDTLRYAEAPLCDSIRFTHYHTLLTLLERQRDTTICRNELPLLWEDSLWTDAGIKTKHLTSVGGCDSIVTLTMTVNELSSSDTAISVMYPNLPYLWHGLQINEAGTYRDTLVNAAGCDSIITLTLTVPKQTDYPLNPMPFLVYRDTIDTIICMGDVFEFNGIPYTMDGTYHDTGYYWFGWDSVYWVIELETKACCDTIRDTVDITVPYQTYLAYDWFGELRDTAGIYCDTLVNAASNGCDSIGWLILRTEYRDSLYVCEDDTALFHTPWGDYGLPRGAPCREEWIRFSPEGDGLVYIRLCAERLKTDTVREDTTLCYGSSMLWHGLTIDHTQEYQYREPFMRLTTCDSVVYILNAVIRPEPQTHAIADAVCAGSTYVWTTYHDSVISVPGMYYDTLWTDHGCYSDVYELNLSHIQPIFGVHDTTVCRGALPVIWEDYLWLDGGTKTKPLISAAGCDSTVTVTLYIDEPTWGDTTAYICAGEAFIWYGDTAVDGDKRRIPNAAGCDSIITLHLIEKPLSFTDIADVICRAELPYLWHSKTLTDAGTLNDTLVNAVGCDSVVTLTLTVNEASIGDTTAHICAGDDFTWYGTIAHDGDQMTFTNTAGCDSVVTLHLVTDMPSASDTADIICRTELPYLWHGKQLTDAGTLEDTLVNAVGCDSIITLTLAIKEPTASDTTARICAGDDFTWYGTIAHDGDQITFTNAVGCDSIVTLRLVMNPTYHQEVNLTVCNMQLPYTWNGITCTQADDYIFSGSTVLGCDSIVTLHLAVDAFSASDTAASICRADLPYIWHEKVLTDAGSLKDTLVNAVDCDSIITLTLTVNEATTGDTTAHICAGDDFMWYGVVAHDGDQMTFTNAAGCDSVVTLHLVTDNPSTSDTADIICRPELPYLWHGKTLTDAGTLNDTLVNAVGCDSIVTLTLTVNEASIGDTTVHICAGDDFMWYGVVAHDGDQMTFTNAVGCDSVVTLHLVTDMPSTSDTADIICRSELPYLWHGKTLTDAGTLNDTLVNAVGCDSIVTLTLTVNEATTGDTTAHVCAGDDFMWYGVVAHDGDQITFTNAAGCDSVVTLHLAIGNCCPDTVHRESAISLCDTLLPYTWTTYRDIPITQVGSYTDTLRNAAGCDSIIYYLQLSTYDCCAPLRAAIRIPDVCADAATMDIIVDSLQGSLYAYRVHYTNAAGNTMPFRDTTVTGLSYIEGEPFIITLPVPNDPNDRRNYPRPDTYALSLTLYNTCGDSIQWVSVPFNVLFPSWILDQHWDDVIALLNDRYNGGYTFSDIKWLRDGEILPGEYEPYIYLPHQLWTSEEHTYQPYTYQALLTREDDGKAILTCPITPDHIDSTNILSEPYVAVTPTYVPHENPVVHVMTNTRGTYWVYDMTGKLLQTADYEPCYHGVFEIWLNPTQTIYILVFTPRNEAKPLQKKYRAIKVVMK